MANIFPLLGWAAVVKVMWSSCIWCNQSFRWVNGAERIRTEPFMWASWRLSVRLIRAFTAAYRTMETVRHNIWDGSSLTITSSIWCLGWVRPLTNHLQASRLLIGFYIVYLPFLLENAMLNGAFQIYPHTHCWCFVTRLLCRERRKNIWHNLHFEVNCQLKVYTVTPRNVSNTLDVQNTNARFSRTTAHQSIGDCW